MTVLERLAATIDTRRTADPEVSWTARLLLGPKEKTIEKFGEEAIEAIVAAGTGRRDRLVAESADVLYHLLVMLAAHEISFGDVISELERREGLSGVAEKASR